MNIKKRTSVGILISFIFSILYIIFCAKPLAKEFQFYPVWKISTSNPVVKNFQTIDDPLLYFHLGQSIGYFTPEGDITLFKTFPSKVSISNSYYAIYDSDSKSTPFYNSQNELAGTINTNGYPYFVNDLIYVFLPGGSSFCKCEKNGDISWTFEGTIPITAFSCNDNYTAVGFADGTIKILNNINGYVDLSYEPGGSDYSIILGLAISPDGEYIASVSGQDRQRFVLTHKEQNQQKIIFHKYLDDNSPYRTSVYFTKDSKKVFYNYENTLGIYDIDTNKSKSINIKNKIISIKEDDNFVYVLSKYKKDYTISIIENANNIEGEFSFSADSAFIQTYNNNLFVGKDTSISKIEIKKE